MTFNRTIVLNGLRLIFAGIAFIAFCLYIRDVFLHGDLHSQLSGGRGFDSESKAEWAALMDRHVSRYAIWIEIPVGLVLFLTGLRYGRRYLIGKFAEMPLQPRFSLAVCGGACLMAVMIFAGFVYLFLDPFGQVPWWADSAGPLIIEFWASVIASVILHTICVFLAFGIATRRFFINSFERDESRWSIIAREMSFWTVMALPFVYVLLLGMSPGSGFFAGVLITMYLALRRIGLGLPPATQNAG